MDANFQFAIPLQAQCSASSITQARAKVKWQAFEQMFTNAVNLAYKHCPIDDSHLWKGHSVFAVDGSKYTLPASKDIRTHFDPDSGLQTQGKGHYPEANVLVAYDVFRRLPIICSIDSVHIGEQPALEKIIADVPKGVLVLDRGYHSYKMLEMLTNRYNGFFLVRCGVSTANQFKRFIASGKSEDTILLKPTYPFRAQFKIDQRRTLKPILVRAIRHVTTDGQVSLLLTNLLDSKMYKAEDVLDLYRKRWVIENHYRNEKVHVEIEKFHSRSANGVRQEFYAAATVAVISRILIWRSHSFGGNKIEPQFKNALLCCSHFAALFVCQNEKRSLRLFEIVLECIARTKYYRHKKPRPYQPRISKQPHNKWAHKKELITWSQTQTLT